MMDLIRLYMYINFQLPPAYANERPVNRCSFLSTL